MAAFWQARTPSGIPTYNCGTYVIQKYVKTAPMVFICKFVKSN